jgi:hypothetical protein
MKAVVFGGVGDIRLEPAGKAQRSWFPIGEAFMKNLTITMGNCRPGWLKVALAGVSARA